MSVGYWWFQAMAPDDQLRSFTRSFAQAIESLREDAPVIRAWQRNPDTLVSDAMICEFSNAFLTDELEAISQSLLKLPGLELPSESQGIVTAQSVTPASIFWFAVGPFAADRLPGRRGAILLESAAVPAATTSLEAVLSEVGRSRLLAQARKYYNVDTTNDASRESTIEVVLESLPRLLRAAHRRSLGVIALSMGEP
jgi:hypothetical protein